MQSAARSVPLNWKNKIEYGRKNLSSGACDLSQLEPQTITGVCGPRRLLDVPALTNDKTTPKTKF